MRARIEIFYLQNLLAKEHCVHNISERKPYSAFWQVKDTQREGL
jgi:hypothetical protein